MHTPFDDDWFAGLLVARALPSPVLVPNPHGTWREPEQETGVVERAEDWGDAPDTVRFVGRAVLVSNLASKSKPAARARPACTRKAH